jgi:hypothetical protein
MDIRKTNRDSAQTLVKQGIQFVPVSPENYEEFEQFIMGIKDQLLEKEFPGESLINLRKYINEYRQIRHERE